MSEPNRPLPPVFLILYVNYCKAGGGEGTHRSTYGIQAVWCHIPCAWLQVSSSTTTSVIESLNYVDLLCNVPKAVSAEFVFALLTSPMCSIHGLKRLQWDKGVLIGQESQKNKKQKDWICKCSRWSDLPFDCVDSQIVFVFFILLFDPTWKPLFW